MEINQQPTKLWGHLYFKIKESILYLINPGVPLLIYVISCNSKPPDYLSTAKPKISYHNQSKQVLHGNISYDSVKKRIYQHKNELAQQYHSNHQNNQLYLKAAKQFTHLFENALLPHWMGTKWDFNGTTRAPGKGAIACGYFVSTTLHDMYVPINIVKCGQAASETTIKMLIDNKHYKNYTGIQFSSFISQLKAKKKFLAIVGLDKHTGFLLNNGNELYFVHSSYINRRGVVKQIASESTELKTSHWKSVGFLTEDTSFLRRWILP